MDMVETITHNEQIYGIIISKDYTKEGIDFFTPIDAVALRGYIRNNFRIMVICL